MSESTQTESQKSSDLVLLSCEDPFLEDKTIWVVDLSNGLCAYQDDDRPGLEEPIAWRRLYDYVRINGLSIKGMRLVFRSHTVELPPNAQGYYFSYGATRDVSSPITRGYYVAGAMKNDVLECNWYSIPELLITQTTNKPIEQLSPPAFILNPR